MSDLFEEIGGALSDRYRLERELGQGGMATVLLARDLRHDRPVAIKVLHAELSGGSAAERFQREVRVAAQLVHPHILPLLDSGQAGRRLWYAMPYVEGESLRERLARERQLPIDEAMRIAHEVAGALHHAHTRGIVHRDVKPDNILLAGGHALVADFGIARALGGAEPALTSTGMAVGTPLYMSPEQATGDAVDARTDVYALGCVLYEMLAGEPPWSGPTAHAIQARRLSGPAISVRRLRATVNAAVDATLQKALEAVPADRFATAEEFALALERARATGPGEAARGALAQGDAVQPARRGGRRAAIGAAVMVAAVGLALLLVPGVRPWGRGAPGAPAPASAVRRLAVLPLVGIGSAPEDEYFADGLTSEIISSLSRLSGLQVVARTSVMPYKGSTARIADIAHDLGVPTLVEGSVQRAGNRVHIALRLVDAATESPLWSQEFERTLSDVLGVQTELAQHVTDALAIRLDASALLHAGRGSTQNPAALDLFLRARVAGDDSAIAFLGLAVRADPSFAMAWADLAERATARLFNFDRRLDADSLTVLQARASDAIARALALDSELAGGWVARGELAWTKTSGWRVADALRDLHRAVQLEPSLADAHQALGSIYQHYGLFDSALAEYRLSLQLDPLDGCPLVRAACAGFSRPRVGRVFWQRGQYDSALVMLHGTSSNDELAIVLAHLGRVRDGLQVLSAEGRRGRSASDVASAQAVLLALDGRRAEALRRIADAERTALGTSHFHHAQYNIATAYAVLGDTAEAVRWLRATAENGMPNYPLFAGDPFLQRLRGSAAFEAFLEAQRRAHAGYEALTGKGS